MEFVLDSAFSKRDNFRVRFGLKVCILNVIISSFVRFVRCFFNKWGDLSDTEGVENDNVLWGVL